MTPTTYDRASASSRKARQDAEPCVQASSQARPARSTTTIRCALPKGRMQEGVLRLFAEAGVDIQSGARSYRPNVPLAGFETKLLKPQNIVEMLSAGTRDVGFAGADWVAELDADLVELCDTGLDPVRIVAAAPRELVPDGLSLTECAAQIERPLLIASEYERLTRRWIADLGIEARFVLSYGATEVFPPEDADVIVDNTATGSTLEANGLVVVEELMRSSTRLYASREAYADPARRAALDDLVLLFESVLEARRRVMVEVNVGPDALEAVVATLPCMREPTIATLHGRAGYAVKAAVPRRRLPELVPLIKAAGGTDVVVSRVAQIVA